MFFSAIILPFIVINMVPISNYVYHLFFSDEDISKIEMKLNRISISKPASEPEKVRTIDCTFKEPNLQLLICNSLVDMFEIL